MFKPSLMPADLADIINTHRALFGGFTMMADEPSGETPPAQESETPVVEEPASPPETDWKAEARKWEDRSKDNHAKLQQAQQAQQSQLDAIAQALGLKDKQTTPEQLTEQLTAEKDAARLAQVQLAVYRNAGDADPDRLLDSSTFINSLQGIDPSDTDAVAQKVKEAVDKSPWLRRTGGSNGDLHQGHETPPAQANLNDLLRAASGRG